MKRSTTLLTSLAALAALAATGEMVSAATTIQLGTSGKTYASSTVQCATDPNTGQLAPMVQAGLLNPRRTTTADVALNGAPYDTLTSTNPVTELWLALGSNTVIVALGRKTADTYQFSVPPEACVVPNTSGNTFSPDGTLEYGASGKSYATVSPGCALNASTGQPQPYVNLFDNGGYLLNVSVNGIPLTQLSTTRPHTPVFLIAGQNVISAANGSLSTDYYVRDGGSGSCTLP